MYYIVKDFKMISAIILMKIINDEKLIDKIYGYTNHYDENDKLNNICFVCGNKNGKSKSCETHYLFRYNPPPTFIMCDDPVCLSYISVLTRMELEMKSIFTCSNIQGKTVNVKRTNGTIHKCKIAGLSYTRDVVVDQVIVAWYEDDVMNDDENDEFNLDNMTLNMDGTQSKSMYYVHFCKINPDISHVLINSLFHGERDKKKISINVIL
jgi:hypothetical protein